MALDTTFGFITYDKFRKFWISITPFDSASVSTDLRIGLLVIKRILMVEVAKSVITADKEFIKDPLSIWYRFLDFYKFGIM